MAAFIVVTALTVWRPEVLAYNAFLGEMATPELVAILVIILTITLASVANIHLSLTRLEDHLDERKVANAGSEIDEARREINGNAWLLSSVFCVFLALLLIKGHWPDDVWVLSVVHAGAIMAIVINLLVLHDIYSSIYALVTVKETDFPRLKGDGTDQP